MQFSDRFLGLVDQQLSSFESDDELEVVVAYVAKTNEKNSPTLEIVGQRPKQIQKVLSPIDDDPDLRVPSFNRRWYPLQEGSMLLGVLRAERFPTEKQWSESLDKRLQISASVLANSLSLELEREKLLKEINQQRDQIGVLVHQLRNPLTALRTYAQLLLRKLGPESQQIDLVKGLLDEQKQLDKYLVALDQLSQPKLNPNEMSSARLLLPPLMPTHEPVNLMELLNPLISRAETTAKLQGYKWVGPSFVPDWLRELRSAEEGVIAEIVANLLENAFRYSPQSATIGICFDRKGICVWDTGKAIPDSERAKIFQSGYRGGKNKNHQGSGIGLSLGRNLAKQFGGQLKLLESPACFDDSLPKEGNAFVIVIPVE